jgi:hypothetical protein
MAVLAQASAGMKESGIPRMAAVSSDLPTVLSSFILFFLVWENLLFVKQIVPVVKV